MSKLTAFREAERELKAQLEKLDALRNDQELKREIEFEEKLRALLGEYNLSLPQVITILDPEAGRRRSSEASSQTQPKRRARALKRYVNPNTNEVIETKGGNHKELKQWKAEHGADVVESWLQQ